MSKTVPTDDLIYKGHIYRYYGDAKPPAIKYRSSKGGWINVSPESTKTKSGADDYWKWIFENRDQTKRIEKRGCELVIVDSESTSVAVVKKGKLDTMSNLQPFAAHINEKYVQFETVEKEATMLMLEIGVMLEAVKEQLPHGQLMKWVKDNVTISYRHATRFRELAQVFIKATNLNNDECLLLCDPENSKEALGEKLRQMAFDFLGDKTQAELFEQYKIKYQEKAEPKPLNLPKQKPLADGETQAHRDATELIYPLIAQLNRWVVSDERVVQHLTIQELKVLQGDLIDAKRIVDGLIKAG